MRIKPIPLAAYCKDLIPPVTGIGGSLAPVANSYDTSGNISGRPREGSFSKKGRIDEIDRVFDLSAPYPPVTPPRKLSADLGEIKTLLVAAKAASEEAGPLLENPDLDPKLKVFGNLGMALLGVVAAIVEHGMIPLLAGLGSGASLQGLVPTARSGPVPPPKTAAGIKELKASLEKADTESILFDANLGNFSMGNRNGLNTNFSIGIRNAAIKTANAKSSDPSVAVRAMNDALECITELDFIGLKSEKNKKQGSGNKGRQRALYYAD
jgi:hypothetical protein